MSQEREQTGQTEQRRRRVLDLTEIEIEIEIEREINIPLLDEPPSPLLDEDEDEEEVIRPIQITDEIVVFNDLVGPFPHSVRIIPSPNQNSSDLILRPRREREFNLANMPHHEEVTRMHFSYGEYMERTEMELNILRRRTSYVNRLRDENLRLKRENTKLDKKVKDIDRKKHFEKKDPVGNSKKLLERLKEEQKETMCPICCDDYGKKKLKILLECTHHMCTKCYKTIKRTKPECPYCKCDLTQVGYEVVKRKRVREKRREIVKNCAETILLLKGEDKNLVKGVKGVKKLGKVLSGKKKKKKSRKMTGKKRSRGKEPKIKYVVIAKEDYIDLTSESEAEFDFSKFDEEPEDYYYYEKDEEYVQPEGELERDYKPKRMKTRSRNSRNSRKRGTKE